VWRAFLALSAGALFSASFPVHFLEFLTYKFMLQPPKNSRTQNWSMKNCYTGEEKLETRKNPRHLSLSLWHASSVLMPNLMRRIPENPRQVGGQEIVCQLKRTNKAKQFWPSRQV